MSCSCEQCYKAFHIVIYIVKQKGTAWITPAPSGKFEPKDTAFERTFKVHALTTDYLVDSIIIVIVITIIFAEIYILCSHFVVYEFFYLWVWYKMVGVWQSSYRRIALWFLIHEDDDYTCFMKLCDRRSSHSQDKHAFKLRSILSLHSLKHKLHQYHSVYTTILIDNLITYSWDSVFNHVSYSNRELD